MLVRLLARGHLRSRWKRYALLAVALGVGLVGFLATLMLIDGARDALIEPLKSTISGPVRVTNGTEDLGAGAMWLDYGPTAKQLERIAGGPVVPRLESNYITFRGADYDNWSAGLLVGIDPLLDPTAADLSPYVTWGIALPGDFVFDEVGDAYHPMVLGEAAASRLNLTLNATGRPDFEHPLSIISGRTVAPGSLQPLILDVVVVGVFETGLEPLDKFTAFVPIPHARYLAGFAENDPVANAFLVPTDHPDEVANRIEQQMGLSAVTASEFAFSYMGSMLVVLYAATFMGVGLFVVVFLVWLVHETSSFLRADEPILSSLRAIGVPPEAIERSYVGLATLAVACGAVGAALIVALASPLLPPLQWGLSGLRAEIVLEFQPLWTVGTAVGVIAVAWLAAVLTARRIGALNILQGLRRA